MREWLTAREIAEAGLPDVPSTKSGVIRLAQRAGWNGHPTHARLRAGREGGGGTEYHYTLLPTVAQVAYAQQEISVGALAPAQADRSLAEYDTAGLLSARAERERAARLAVLGAFDRMTGATALGQHARLKAFCDRYNLGAIEIDEWVRKAVPTVSKRTLQSWQAARRAGRDTALGVDRGAARKGTGVLDTAEGGRLKAFVLALIADRPALSAEHVRTLCLDEFGDVVSARGKTVAMPPIRTFQHALKGLRTTHKVALTRLTNPDLYRSTMIPRGVGTLRHVRAPNALWMIDASPVDALCSDGRHAIYACIDIATRRLVLHVSKTPRASAVGLLIRKAILAWGVPELVKTDNGADFAAAETKRLFASLGVEIAYSDPYSPEQKGHVERVIRTFQHDAATLLPGYVGHSVAERKAIEGRKSFAQRLGSDDAELFGVGLSGAELQAKVDDWATYAYGQRTHSALDGQSPAEVAARSAHPVRHVDARALDMLLMPAAGKNGLRTTTKFGIRIDHYHYAIASVLPGEQVFVRHDPSDMGRVYAFTPDGETYLGEGICPELAGIDPAAYLAEVRAAHAELARSFARDLVDAKKSLAKGPALIDRYNRRRKAEAIARAGNVVELPRRTEAHSTPQIAAALEAVSTPAPSPVREDVARLQAELLAEDRVSPAPSNVQPLRAAETMHQRFRRALAVEARLAAGEPVEADEARWLGSYQAGTEYRSMRDIWEESGGAMSL